MIIVMGAQVLLVSGLFTSIALAKVETQTQAKRSFTLKGNFLTQMHLRNDNDFDGSERFDDLDGQSDGQLASFFSPIFTARAGGDVMVRYQLDLGWNAWSRNDPGQPNQFFSMRTPGLLARHKQAWAQWKGDGVRLRAGFQQVKDPTGLFLDHTIGALKAMGQTCKSCHESYRVKKN